MIVRRTLKTRCIRRRPRVLSCIDYRPVPLIPTTLAIPVVMNDELKDMQAKRRAVMALSSTLPEEKEA